MRPARQLMDKINSGRITTGMLCTFHFWHGLVEHAVHAGLDYLIVDLEHFTHSHERIAEACAFARALNFPLLIRPPAAEVTAVRHAMDLGACGLLVPDVASVEDMQRIAEGCLLPPRGKRRPGGPGVGWVSAFHYENWKTEVEDDLIIVPQIESRRGLENVGAIAAHPLTAAIGLGPYDLSADLGVCWHPEAPPLRDAIDRVREAGRKVGKKVWRIGDGATLAAEGDTFLCIGEPSMTLQAAMQTADRAARNGLADPTSAADPLP